MTGNQVLDAFDRIAEDDFTIVLGDTTAIKLIHINNGLRIAYKRLKRTGVCSYSHAGGTVTLTIKNLVPRFLEVYNVRFQEASVDRSLNYIDAGWHTPNDDTLILRELAAGSYDIEGYTFPAAIAATDTEITAIEDELFIPIVKFAVHAALGAHEETQEQMVRRRDLLFSANDDMTRFAQPLAAARLKALF